MTLTDLVPTLQLAIGPMILVSGIGLILLSMTNRFGRIIDRSRQLVRDLEGAAPERRARTLAELRILARRARIVRAGIALCVLSALLAALLVMALFVGVLFSLDIASVVVALFGACMACLIGALACFVSDINHSLGALWLEMPAEVRAGR
jgi:hypothetical protein